MDSCQITAPGIISKAIIYEVFAMCVIYIISVWWFQRPPYETLEYTLVVFIALMIYYTTFHYIGNFLMPYMA